MTSSIHRRRTHHPLPQSVASFLGHKNATETLSTYAHLWPNDEERMTAAIDG